MKRVLFIVVFLSAFSTATYAQDAIFSQFYNASLYLNPALAGDEENVVLNVSHRSQWQKIHFPYTTSQASLIIPHYLNQHRTPLGHRGGFGVSLFNDISGDHLNFSTMGGNLSYAYNLVLDKKANNRISFALQAGFIQKRVDTDNLQWGQQYDPFIGFNAEVVPDDISRIDRKTYVDISSGVFWRYAPEKKTKRLINSAYSGLSVAHLNNPNESPVTGSVSHLPLLYKYHGGVVFGLSRKASISANVLTMIQDRENQTNFGSYFTYAIPVFAGGNYTDFLLRVGGWYRVNDAVIGNLEFVLDRFKVGFSYDWNASSLRYNNRGVGAYEVSVGINLTRFAPPKVRY